MLAKPDLALRLLLPILLLLLPGCDRNPPIFKLLPPERTGINFINTILTTETHGFFNDPFIYNGAGVAVGDIDDDGLQDVYLTGNMVSSRLYLNLGDMRFEDITETAEVGTDRWATGASMVDIDGDGDLDIYVSVSGPEWSTPDERANVLFINEGNNTFAEAASAYGIADTSFTTHSIFLDYDLDGHLDLFVLANSPGEFGRGETGRTGIGSQTGNPAGFDRLYRNNGNGTFSNVSDAAGILQRIGYGLGVLSADLNRDGWPDIYVSNDVAPNDVLYINNRDGTFTDRAAEWLGHTSYAGMGMDIADFNNDGWPDILQTDMMPEELSARQRVSGATTYGDLDRLYRMGFSPQYSLNTLQLNRGVADDGRIVFSEIARMAGVSYTDWSWTALFGDYDNDGLKDVFITNGYPKAVTDLDYQFGRGGRYRVAADPESQQQIRQVLEMLEGYNLPNYVFRNNGDLTFTDRSAEWGLEHAGFSYGAARADLDNDGRLDLVVNNIDGPAFVYENVLPATEHHYLQVRLDGEPPNRGGTGAKLILTAGGRKQYVDHTPYRGYMSSMDDRIHFGLGPADRADSLEVIWPDGRYQLLRGVAGDRVVTVRQRDATRKTTHAPSAGREPSQLFRPVGPDRGLEHEHRRNAYGVDYAVQPHLPYEISRQGPPVAVADVDQDGLDDLFVGGAAGFPGRLLLQQRDGRFIESAGPRPWEADASHEDWGAHFFDANGDGLPDLYVASGGYDLPPSSPLLQDRLYFNQGNGSFVKAVGALPEMLTSTASVAAGDLDGDGRMDLFVGGRLTPRNYPVPARSYILRNLGGRFTEVAADVAPELNTPGGMITDAVWMDFNGDGRLDLVTAGTWMPVRFYANDGNRLRDVTASTDLPPMRGWWFRLGVGDLDQDGLPDLVAGNLGLNHSYMTSSSSPFGVYAADFNEDRTMDLVFTREIDGTEYPFYGLAVLGANNIALRLRFPTYTSFAGVSVEEAFGPEQLQEALQYQVDTFASVWLRNKGNGTFSMSALPPMAQISPLRGIVIEDVDGDGNVDLVVAGNLYRSEANAARADAGKGLLLRGDGRGGFRPVSPSASGLLAPLDVTDLALVRTLGGKILVVANQEGPLQAYTVRP